MDNLQKKLLETMMPSAEKLIDMKNECDGFVVTPLISIIMPTYNTDLKMLDEAIKSVQNQVYKNWELVIVDDCSLNHEVRDKIINYSKNDSRITKLFLEQNHHIARATNEGFKIAKDEYIALLDHDDYLYPNALYENVKRINENPKVKFIYSDEDKIEGYAKRHFSAYLKPDFDFDFLRCINIITHFVVFKSDLLNLVSGEDPKYNGAQDWEFVMRLIDILVIDEIAHIDKVIYSWRVHSKSTALETGAKPYVPEAQRNLLRKDIEKKKNFGIKIYENHDAIGQWLFQYPVIGLPLVSIVLKLTKETKYLEKLLNSIFIKTSYHNYEVVFLENQVIDKFLFEKYIERHDNISSKINGEYIVLIDGNFEILTFDWLEKMIGQIQRDNVAYVMPRILSQENNIVESVGLAVAKNGEIINLLNGFDLLSSRTLTEHIHLTTNHHITAVTPNCYMTKKSLFDLSKDVITHSIELNQGEYYNVFVSDVHIKNNSLNILNKSFGVFPKFIDFIDPNVNSNFLKIEQKYIRGEKI
ncbi:MAG: glycosyltransferase [Methanobrevibacter sp.]|nr:glycosyltransferase [Methanobrevibacter sp.]